MAVKEDEEGGGQRDRERERERLRRSSTSHTHQLVVSVYPWTSGSLLEGQCGMPTASAWPNSTTVPRKKKKKEEDGEDKHPGNEQPLYFLCDSEFI